MPHHNDLRRGGIKWLASWPKSGNTWARLFLLNWHSDANEPIHPNELGRLQFATADDAQWLVSSATGVEPTEVEVDGQKIQRLPLPPVSFMKMRPAFQKHFLIRARKANLPPYMKTHSPNLVWQDFYPMIDWDITESACYFIRDPRDVLPSFAAHTNNGFDKAVSHMADINYGLMRPSGTLSPVGHWSGHVKSWEGKATVIRYEDLPDGFEALLETFGLPKDERFDKAVEFTRLEILSELEDKDGFGEASQHAKFFGGKRRSLNKTQRAKLEDEHGEVMERYGYTKTVEKAA